VTLVRVDGSSALGGCGEIHDLTVHEVGGTHETMLLPPNVEGLATVVAAVARDWFERACEQRQPT
jgi:hypothetical protein